MSRITEDELILVLLQYLQALVYIHGLNISQRDIKPENILVQTRDPKIHVKLGDFGLASDERYLRTVLGIPQ